MNNTEKYLLKYLNENEFHLWDQFVDNNEYGTIFNKTFYLKKLAECLGISFCVLAAFNSENQISGGFAFCHAIKFKKIKTIFYPPLVKYYSILIQETQTKYKLKKQDSHFELLNKILNFLENEFSLLVFDFPPNYKDVRPFIWKNYKVDLRYTYCENLQNIFNLEENFEYSLKKQIKKGKNLFYKIVCDNSLVNISNLYSIQRKAFDKIKLNFDFSEKTFIDLITELYKTNSVKIYTLFYEDKPISSTLVYFHKTNVYHLLFATDEKFFNTGLSSVLLLEMFYDLKNKGFLNFDFLGANIENIARYKAQYNFELQTFVSLTKAHGISKSLLKIRKVFKH